MSYDLKKWIQCAEADLKGGVYSIPLKWEQKYPVNKEWQNLRLGPEEFPQSIESECNRGRLLGIPPPEGLEGGWVVCVDLDSEAARQLAPCFLPPTGEIGPSDGDFPAPRGNSGDAAASEGAAACWNLMVPVCAAPEPKAWASSGRLILTFERKTIVSYLTLSSI